MSESQFDHVFQLLMIAQLPIMAFFSIKWLPCAPGTALEVLAFQAIADLAILSGVFLLNL
jgi:hypothetical protein